METFMHEFKSPVSTYTALAVRHGLNVYPVASFDGRLCYCLDAGRVFGGRGRNFHNRVSVHFLDNGEVRNIPAGQWARRAKTPKNES